MKNIFLAKSYTNSDAETFTRPFSKKSKLSIVVGYAKALESILCQIKGYQNMLKLSCRPHAFIL